MENHVKLESLKIKPKDGREAAYAKRQKIEEAKDRKRLRERLRYHKNKKPTSKKIQEKQDPMSLPIETQTAVDSNEISPLNKQIDPAKNKTSEEEKKKARERQRRRRAKIYADPNKWLKFLENQQINNQKRREKGLRSIATMSKQEQMVQRKLWRENQNNYRKKLAKNTFIITEIPEPINATAPRCAVVKEEPCLMEQSTVSHCHNKQSINYRGHTEDCSKIEMDFFEGLNNEDASSSNFQQSFLKRRTSDSVENNGSEADTGSGDAKMENRKAYEREKKRKQRLKIYSDATLHEEFLQKQKQYYQDRKKAGFIKSIANLHEAQKCEQRKIWKNRQRNHRQYIKQIKNEQDDQYNNSLQLENQMLETQNIKLVKQTKKYRKEIERINCISKVYQNAKESVSPSRVDEVPQVMDISPAEMLSSDETLPVTCSTGNDTFDWSVVKAKLLSGEYKLNMRKGRSKVWEIFGPILTEVGQEIPHVVACKECCNIFKLNKNSTSNLMKHKWFPKTDETTTTTEVNLGTKKEIAGVVTQWIVENCRSIKMLEDVAFKKLVKNLLKIGAQYGSTVSIEKLLPQPNIIAKNIDILYERCFNAVKADLKEVRNYGYGLTADLWAENYLETSYLSLTVHYIKDGVLTKRLLGLKSIATCTEEDILHKVQNILLDFDFILNSANVVTNRNSNLVAAFRQHANRINCVNHLLHDALEQSLGNVPAITELCRTCKNVVEFLNKSSTNRTLCDALKSSAACKRWNKTYYFLHSIEKNWTQIKSILQAKNENQKINDIQLNRISALVKFLQPFEESSRTLQSESYSTICLVIVHVYRLRRICEINIADIPMIKSLKELLNVLLDSEVLQNLTIFHKIALFLFPPANKLSQYTEDERTKIKKECKRIMQTFPEQTEQISSSSPSHVSSSTVELFSGFVKPNEFLTTEDKINSEMQIYENTNVVLHDGFNVLHWWNLHRAEFPFLFKLSCKVLATPASSFTSEITLAKARNLISEKNSSNGTNQLSVNKMMFLHCNLNENHLRSELENKDNIMF